jgi:hypothetical protein
MLALGSDQPINSGLASQFPTHVRYKPGKPGRSVMVDGPVLEPEPIVMKTDFNA